MTLSALLAKHGRADVPASLAPALRLAVRAHGQRVRDGVADREALNRSTSLWALLAANPEMALAAAEGNLYASAMKDELGIVGGTSTEGEPPPSVILDDPLRDALDEHLSRIDPDDLDPVAVTTAILNSCAQPGGLLPQRLATLGVAREAAVDALAAWRDGRPAGFSRSVRLARQELGPDAAVSAADLLRQLIRQHPVAELSGLSEHGVGDPVATTDGWLTRIGSLFDAAEVVISPHGILDTELVLRGLVEVDRALARRLDGDTEAMRWVESIRPSPVAERRTEPTADVPAQTDLLGRGALAKTLLKQLELISQRAEDSILVHLDGAWGSGKSSLFVFLKRAVAELEKPQDADADASPSTKAPAADGGPRYLVVDVNAWREQRVGAQWWTLYRALRVAHLSAAGTPARRLASRLRHLKDVVSVRRDKMWPLVLSFLVLCLGSGLVVRLGLDSDIGIPEILSIAAVITTALTAAYRFLVPVSPRSARALVETSTNPMAEVRELFARSVQRAGPRRVLFLIDDLDRCDPDYVIRFLEVVQTLVRDAPCEISGRRGRHAGEEHLGPYAVVAADGLWLRSSYEKAYGELIHDDVPGKPVGYRFLEKIFQMHVRLPAVEAASKQRYYESLLFPDGHAVSHAASHAAPHDESLQNEVTQAISGVRSTGDLSVLNRSIGEIADPATRQRMRSNALERAITPAVVQRQLHELIPFADLLDSNPRTIRLFVNAVSNQAYLRFMEGAEFELSSLALWAVLEARWPALADHLREHPEHLSLSKGEDPPRGLPAELLELMRSREVEPVLANRRWGAFTPDRVRACIGGDRPGG